LSSPCLWVAHTAAMLRPILETGQTIPDSQGFTRQNTHPVAKSTPNMQRVSQDCMGGPVMMRPNWWLSSELRGRATTPSMPQPRQYEEGWRPQHYYYPAPVNQATSSELSVSKFPLREQQLRVMHYHEYPPQPVTYQMPPGSKRYYFPQCTVDGMYQYPKRRRMPDPSHQNGVRMRALPPPSVEGYVQPVPQTSQWAPHYDYKTLPPKGMARSEVPVETRKKTEKDEASLLLSLALASEMLDKDGKEKQLDTSSISISTTQEDNSTSSTETKNYHDDELKNASIPPPPPLPAPTRQVIERTPTVASNSSGTTSTKSTSSSKGKPFKCEADGCNCSFSTRFSLKRHMKKHTGERPHVCPYNCGKRFAEKSTLTRHVRIHTGERPYICKFPGCGKSFADRTNVKRHELIHLGQRPYHCKYCQRGFFRPKHVVKHVAKMHPNVQEQEA